MVLAALGHAGLLAVMLSTLRREPLPAGPVIQVELAPLPRRTPEPPVPAEEEPEERPERRTRAQAAASPLPLPVAPRPSLPAPPPLPAPAATPAPAAPASGPPAAAPAASATPARPAGPPGDIDDRLRSALRTTVGCPDGEVIGLTRRERERCDEGRGARTRDAPPAPLPTAKQRAFDATVQGRNPPPNARDKVFHDKGIDCHGSNMGMGCMPKLAKPRPFGKPPKAITPIPPSTLRGDDDALRPKPKPEKPPA
jgi:hypothetical protein